MKKSAVKLLSILLIVLWVATLSGITAMAANQVSGNWTFTVENGEATLLWGGGAEKEWKVIMFPAQLGGASVTTLGGQGAAVSNNSAGGYVLFPEGYTTICASAVYDYNTTLGWSFPSTLTVLDKDWSSSIKPDGVFYAAADSVAAQYAHSNGNFTVSQDTVSFTAAFGEGGQMLPNGEYSLPKAMLSGSYSTGFSVTASSGYAIDTLIVDGAPMSEASGNAEYSFDYTFTSASSAISVSFVKTGEAVAEEEQTSYVAPALIEGAVADGAALPEDLNDYVDVSGAETAKYTNTMGVSTGSYYAAGDSFYSQVTAYTSKEAPMFHSKAEVINYAFTTDGLVFGRDYTLIRLYNYHEFITGGPGGGGDTHWYCAYLYAPAQEEAGLEAIVGSYLDTLNGISETNNDSLFVQAGAVVALDRFHSQCYTAGCGPQEAGNFFGLASGIQVDGGDAATYSDGNVNSNTTSLVLVDPTIDGAANSIYAAANGKAWIYGGLIFSCSSGGHGPYVSSGGQIMLNTTPGDGILSEDGKVNTDAESLKAAAQPIPDASLALMQRADPDAEEFSNENEMRGYRTDEADRDDSVTVILTGDEAGTALATDTGGGIIVANRVVTKAFGNGSGGVYSIGSDESWIYVYNSNINSYIDAGLVSASGGYVYAFNSQISGVAGIKTRSGGSANAEATGIYVDNSKVVARYDNEEMKRVYDVATPEQFWSIGDQEYWESYAKEGMNNKSLNMFVLKAQMQVNNAGLTYWFEDKNLTPVTGNKFAVIYIDGASTPIYVNSTYLYNENYDLYKDEGAVNWLITAENAANGTIYFTNQNSDTHWNVLDSASETCEMIGDINIAETVTSTDPGMSASGPSSLDIYFTASQWTGQVRGYGYGCNLYLDEDSSWTVTGDTVVGTVEVGDASCVVADEPVTVYFQHSETIEEGTVGNVTFVRYYSRHFSDVFENIDDIDALADDGIVLGFGDGTFQPDSVMQTAHLINMLARAADENNAASWAGANGIDISGYGKELTVDAAYEILFKACKALDIEITATDAVSAAKELGIYDPSLVGTITRSQAATMFVRFKENIPVMDMMQMMMMGGDPGGGGGGPH